MDEGGQRIATTHTYLHTYLHTHNYLADDNNTFRCLACMYHTYPLLQQAYRHMYTRMMCTLYTCSCCHSGREREALQPGPTQTNQWPYIFSGHTATT